MCSSIREFTRDNIKGIFIYRFLNLNTKLPTLNRNLFNRHWLKIHVKYPVLCGLLVALQCGGLDHMALSYAEKLQEMKAGGATTEDLSIHYEKAARVM